MGVSQWTECHLSFPNFLYISVFIVNTTMIVICISPAITAHPWNNDTDSHITNIYCKIQFDLHPCGGQVFSSSDLRENSDTALPEQLTGVWASNSRLWCKTAIRSTPWMSHYLYIHSQAPTDKLSAKVLTILKAEAVALQRLPHILFSEERYEVSC